MDHDGPTDVITQRYNAHSRRVRRSNWRTVRHVERAHCRATPHGMVALDHELALYLAHGRDHLTGADDTHRANAPARAAKPALAGQAIGRRPQRNR